MKFAYLGFAAALALCVPALAQNGAMPSGGDGNMSNSGTASNPGSTGSQTSTGSTMSSTASTSGAQTCQGMMDQTLSQGEMQTTASMKSEMKMAKKAQAKGDEQGCMMHMRKAMGGSQ